MGKLSHNAEPEASSSHPGAGCSDPERLLWRVLKDSMVGCGCRILRPLAGGVDTALAAPAVAVAGSGSSTRTGASRGVPVEEGALLRLDLLRHERRALVLATIFLWSE